jgi:hypothetical protein
MWDKPVYKSPRDCEEFEIDYDYLHADRWQTKEKELIDPFEDIKKSGYEPEDK